MAYNNKHNHPKTNRVRSAATRNSIHREDVLTGLAELCQSHDGTNINSGADSAAGTGPLGATCVHGEGYGTRSSILLRLSEDPKQNELLHADGAPCVHPYEDSTPLLHELSRSASYTGQGSITRKAS